MNLGTRLALAACLSALSSSTSFAQTFYVDPVAGIDSSTNGGLANPFRSVRFAISQRSIPIQQLTIYLKPGEYSQASGEVFPIQLGDQMTIEGVGFNGLQAEVRGARFVYPAGPIITAIFRTSPANGPGTQNVFLRRFAIDTGHRGIWVTNESQINAEELDIRALRPIDVMPTPTSWSANLTLERCRLRCTASNPLLNSMAASIDSGGGGSTVVMRGCDISSGDLATRAIVVNTSIGTGVILDMESCVVHNSASGVYATRSGGLATATFRVVGCTFWGLGLAMGEGGLYTVNGVLGAYSFGGGYNLFDNVTPGQEMTGTGFFNYSLVQYNRILAPPGTSTNFNGPVYFADPFNGDFHILPAPAGQPASAVIDRPVPSTNYIYSFDIDGGPRQACSKPTLPIDIGADEHEDHWVYVNPPFTLNQTSVISMTANGGVPEAYALFMGVSPTTSIACPGGFVLGGAVFLVSGAVPVSNRATLPISVPNSPSLLGYPVVLQALFLDPLTNVLVASNLEVEPVRP